MQAHGEVQVIATGQSRLAAPSEFGVHLDGLAFLHADGVQVGVERLQAHAVIDDHAVAVDAEEPGKHDGAAIGGVNRRVLRGREVEAEVDLSVDRPCPCIRTCARRRTRPRRRSSSSGGTVRQSISLAVFVRPMVRMVSLFWWRRSRLITR